MDILIDQRIGNEETPNRAVAVATAPSLKGTGIGRMIGIARLVAIVSPIYVGFLLVSGLPAESIFMLSGAPLLAPPHAMTAVSAMSPRSRQRGSQP